MVAANHLSHVDPTVVGLAVVRPIRFLAVDELWGLSPVLDGAVQAFGAIPLPRTRYPVSAMRTALVHLDSGGRVGVFPEGRRVAAWGEDPPKRGAAWLSLRTGAPLLPVAVWGTERVMPIGQNSRIHPAPISVVVGRAIEPDAYLDCVDPLGAITEAWRLQIDQELSYLERRAAGMPAAG